MFRRFCRLLAMNERMHFEVLFFTEHDVEPLTRAMEAAVRQSVKTLKPLGCAWSLSLAADLLPGPGQSTKDRFGEAMDEADAVVFLVGSHLLGGAKSFSDAIWAR